MEYSLCVGLLLFHLWAFLVTCSAQSGDWIDGESHIQKQTTFACQYSILELACPPHYVIRISRANYGRFSTFLCNPSGVTENLNIRCHSITAVEVISSKCDGHNQCQIPVNNDEFDDPCPGTSKYIEVQHYCEPAKSDENNSGLRPLPDGNRPNTATVPAPEKVQACLHPMARGSVYDLYWEVPETHLTILHFNIMYRVNGVIRNKDVMQATQLEGHKYVYAFTPDENQQSFDHEFAVKAYFLNVGWGDYSPFTPSKHCHLDEDGNHVTLYPIEAATTTSTNRPQDGGGLRQMCSPVNVYGVHWPATAPGEVRTSICPPFLGGRGVMHYKCLSGGVWDRNGPETDDCSRIEYSTTTTTTTTSSTTTTTTTAPTTSSSKEDASKPVSFNNKVTKMLQSLEPAGEGKKDKYNLATFLPNITQNWTQEIKKTKDPKKKKVMADNYKESLLALSEEVLNDDDAWNNMSATQQRQTAASILGSVEQSGLVAASTMPVGTSNVTRKTNVVMKVMNVDTGSGRAATLDDQSVTGSRAKGNWFTIPSGVLMQAATNSGAAVPVVFVVMSDISEWMTPKTSPKPPTNDNVIDARPEEEPKRRLVNTDVVSVSVSTRPMKHLMEPVVFLLEHRQTESVEKAQCSFWDTEKSRWSTEGCKLVESNKTHTVCKCYHLTSFAVLMDITGTTLQLSDGQRFSLELITYIGCTISIICLLLSWVTFTCFKNLDCDRNTIHKHLVFCLMVAQIVLVTGLQQTQPPLLCSIIAGVLHFFFLASFAWMCLEGVQLYVMLIEVFESEHSRVLYYYLFGYGVPAVIVAVSAAVYSGGYGTEFHCWLTVERGFIWSFVGPVLAVLLVNMVMLGIAISIMVRHSTMSHTMRQKSVPQKMRSWVKGAVVLVVLLGLTWVFGVLYLDNVYHTLIFSYIFTILNTLQGLFIFLFHCLMNEKVQKEYRRLVRRCQCLPTCLRARYGYTTSTGSRDNSSSGNVMARLFRGKRRHSGCGDSSSNSAKPFLHKEQRHLSSSVPSSSDGVVTSHLSSENSNNNNRKLSQHSASHSNASDSRFLRPAEMSGIAGELSEILDCSVVDSEFVSEYCQQHMQVSSEVKRYSTSSEDSGGGDELDEESEVDVGERLDRVPASSVESLSKRHSHVISTPDLGNGEKESEGGEESDGGVEGGVVTAPASVNVAGRHEKEEEEEGGGLEGEEVSLRGSTSPETQPLMIKQTDSEQVLILNAVNKPRETRPAKLSPKQSPSLTFIPSSSGQEANRSSPAHTSVPCLKFKPGTTSPPPDVADGEKDSVVISLPDLSHEHQNGTAKKPHPLDLSEDSVSAKRHSSGGRMQFSPFRFSGSDC